MTPRSPALLPALRRNPSAGRVARCAVLLAVVFLSACSSVRPWHNLPLREEAQTASDRQTVRQAIAARDPSMLVAVTLSGGGARAAAFGFGVLSAMQDTRFHWNGKDMTLLSATDVISGVSGGSILAAYFAAWGIEGLPRFEGEFLRQNFQNSLVTQVLHPSNLLELTSPWMGRTHLLARRLDALYGGMTFGELEKRPRHPQLIVAATDMALGTAFEFTWDQFGLICSDLSSVPLSFAVAASSAVPLLLSPMTLTNYAGQCQRRSDALAVDANAEESHYRARLHQTHEHSYLDAQNRPFIHLVDGGLADNLGVQRLLDRALGGGLRSTFSEVNVPPGSIHKLVLITVNAERDPSVNIDHVGQVPTMMQVLDSLLFGTGGRATRETQEFLRDTMMQWRKGLVAGTPELGDAFAPDAEIHVVQVNLRDAPGDLARHRLLQVPTAFSISNYEVTELIEAGSRVLVDSPDFQALMRSFRKPAGADSTPP